MKKRVEAAVASAKTNRESFLDDLIAFASIPSISTDPKYKKDIEITALWVANNLKSLGVNSVHIFPTAGHPIVYGELLKAGKDKPTALIYGHYDVQPAEPFEKWETDPFNPEIKRDKVYARGISDMKGQIIAVLSALSSILNTADFPINIKFLSNKPISCIMFFLSIIQAPLPQ